MIWVCWSILTSRPLESDTNTPAALLKTTISKMQDWKVEKKNTPISCKVQLGPSSSNLRGCPPRCSYHSCSSTGCLRRSPRQLVSSWTVRRRRCRWRCWGVPKFYISWSDASCDTCHCQRKRQEIIKGRSAVFRISVSEVPMKSQCTLSVPLQASQEAFIHWTWFYGF